MAFYMKNFTIFLTHTCGSLQAPVHVNWNSCDTKHQPPTPMYNTVPIYLRISNIYCALSVAYWQRGKSTE